MYGSQSFSWIIENKIGGMAKPDVFGNFGENLINLKTKYGIRTILTLTEGNLDKYVVEQMNIKHFHIPIKDFTAPTLEQFQLFSEIYTEVNFPIAVHCFAGMGRTGTILASALVIEGYSPEDAIGIVRKKRPGSIENFDQEESIRKFYSFIINKKDK